jgi:hypothetical protein
MDNQPLAEGGSDNLYPLCLVRCSNCGLVQLNYIVDQREVFQPQHPYSTSNSRALHEHYKELTRQLATHLLIKDVVVDIGANDGTLLSCYPLECENLVKVAVEPTDQIFKCAPNIDRWHGFFTADLAADMCGDPIIGVGRAKVITACNVLAHVPDIHDFLDGINTLLADDGVFVTENHDWASVEDGLQIDTIYHEHLRYYTPATLTWLLENHGFRVTSVSPVNTHGGSFQVRARKQSLDFSTRAESTRNRLRSVMFSARAEGKIYGIGATTRATSLIYYAGIADCLDRVCEVSNSDKLGMHIPGTSIQIVDESYLIVDQPPYALLLSWHLADDIIPKLRHAGYLGKFIVPLPEARVINDWPV